MKRKEYESFIEKVEILKYLEVIFTFTYILFCHITNEFLIIS